MTICYAAQLAGSEYHSALLSSGDFPRLPLPAECCGCGISAVSQRNRLHLGKLSVHVASNVEIGTDLALATAIGRLFDMSSSNIDMLGMQVDYSPRGVWCRSLVPLYGQHYC